VKPSTKRDINTAVQRAVKEAEHLGLQRQRQGYWTATHGEVQWEVDVLYEQAYGDGVFRVGWGVRVPGVAEILEREELAGTEHATVGGDAGALATRSRRMKMLVVEGGTMSLVNRLLWNVKPEKLDALATRISEWLSGSLTEVFESMTSRQGVVEFLENYQARYGRIEMHPDSQEMALALIAALNGLSGDTSRAFAALDKWRSLIGSPGDDSYSILAAKIDRTRRRIEAL
jgi:hypothetical protein